MKKTIQIKRILDNLKNKGINVKNIIVNNENKMMATGLLMAMLLMPKAEADVVSPISGGSNMRSGANGLATKICVIPQDGEAIRLMDDVNSNWDLVFYKGNIGYVCRDNLCLIILTYGNRVF